MIISVEKAKEDIDFKNWSDQRVERKLKAIEHTIRVYTNNNFQDRGFRVKADIVEGKFISESLIPFKVGDTIMISESDLQSDCLCVVSEVNDNTFTVNEEVADDDCVLITSVKYPDDIVDCALNLLEWEVKNRSKVGVKSETLSRHSVTYYDQDANNQVMGYPVSLLGCLSSYMKARW